MKTFLVVLNLLLTSIAFGSVNSITVKGKIVSFDVNTVTINLAGENYKFHRTKLGREFSALKKGEAVEMTVDKDIK